MTLRKRMRGITLLELMIVVVIIGILAAIAYPSYRQHVQRAKRTEAMSALLRIATEQERYYLNTNEYAVKLADLGIDSNLTQSETYELSLASTDIHDTYKATATYRLDDEEGGKCKTFTIEPDGTKGSQPNSDCWTSTR